MNEILVSGIVGFAVGWLTEHYFHWSELIWP